MINFRYSHFKVKIVEKPFYAETGANYPNTAIITFFDEKERVLSTADFGYLSTNEIYNQIDNNNSISLDYCYVKNFSITAYRRTRILHKKEVVLLDSITAKYAFFNSDYNIDFSYMELGDGDLDFSFAQFAHGNLDFKYTHFGNGRVDFSNVFFRSEVVDFANSIFGEGEVTFKNATFLKSEKNFQYTDFGKGDLIFVNTEFGDGNVLFINSNFNEGNALFKVARFGQGDIDFHYSKFGGGDISFERVDFGDGFVNFKTVEFGKGKVNFNRAVFGAGFKSFEGCSGQGKMTFKKTNLGIGDVNFELTELVDTDLTFEKAELGKGALSFLNSEFRNLSLSGCHINDYLDLRLKKCGLVDLSDTIVRDIIDLKPYKLDVDVDILNIAGMRLLGTIYIDWKANGVEQLIRKQIDTSLAEKADQFLTLKESFNKSGQYNDEDDAYVWFMRYEALNEYKKSQKDKISKIPNALIYGFKKLVFDYMGLYATNPMRVLFSTIVVLAFFGLVYAGVLFSGAGGIVSGLGGEHDLIGVFGRSFYHSGITFFTIGYGDFYPLGAIRWLSNVEGFVGVFLMSYFTVAFVRKILR